MEFEFATAIPDDADTIVVAVEEGRKLLPSASPVDAMAGGAISRAVATGRFKGKKDQMLDIVAPAGVKAERILAVGCGNFGEFTALDRQRLGGNTLAHLNRVGARHVVIPASQIATVCDFAHGMRLRSYRFDLYRTTLKDDDLPTVQKVTLVADDLSGAAEKFARLQALADGVFLTRNLVTEPANTLYPESSHGAPASSPRSASTSRCSTSRRWPSSAWARCSASARAASASRGWS